MMRRAAGIDWGRHGDFTVASRVVYDNPYRLVLDRYRRIRKATMSGRGNPDAQRGGCWSWKGITADVLPAVVGCSPILTDGTGIGDVLLEAVPGALSVVLVGNRPGATVQRLDDVRLSVPTFQLFVPLFNVIRAGQIVVDCDAPGLEAELMNFCVAFTKNGAIRLAARKGHDDGVFSLALAVYGALSGGSLNAAQSTGEVAGAAGRGTSRTVAVAR